MNKNGQEEIVGFVLIMIVFAIAALVFLGISIRQGSPTTTESAEIYQFLESSMEFTTNCSVTFIPDYTSLNELFRECYEGSNCLNGQNACDELEHIMEDILEISWNVGPDSPIKGYAFDSFYSRNTSDRGEQILALETGNCTGPLSGASYLIPAFPGKITTQLELCY